MTASQQATASWSEGTVDTDAEHIEIMYGDFINEGNAGLVAVARVCPGDSPQRFVVQFLLDAPNDKVTAVRKEINYFLIELDEQDPWAYARHHCGSTGNMYGDVHWVLHRPGHN